MRSASLKSSFAWFCLVMLAIYAGTAMGRLSTPAQVMAASDDAREGAALFAARGCTHCHGPQGNGTDSGPSLRELRKHVSAETMEHQIVYGGKEMPAFGDTLDPGQVKSLVAFLRAKKWIVLEPSAAPVP